jgi:hypothetical protein
MAMTSYGDIFFELFGVNCGATRYPTSVGTSVGVKFNTVTQYFEPFSCEQDNHMQDKNLSRERPELVVSANFVYKLILRTARQECDSVKVLQVPGTGQQLELGSKKWPMLKLSLVCFVSSTTR